MHVWGARERMYTYARIRFIHSIFLIEHIHTHTRAHSQIQIYMYIYMHD